MRNKGEDVFICRVCGLGYNDSPWGEDGNSPDYSYCDCCGVEFGNQDYSIESAKRFREEWLRKESVWEDPKLKPPNWDLEEQLKNIPEEYK